MSTSRPTWMRLDLDFGDHPKIMRLRQHGQHAAIALWVEGLAYCGRHLTDGWIPDPWPRQAGYRASAPRALVDVGLWHPLEITDDGGWLINDYPDYQLTRTKWEKSVEQRRSAARKRWGT